MNNIIETKIVDNKENQVENHSDSTFSTNLAIADSTEKVQKYSSQDGMDRLENKAADIKVGLCVGKNALWLLFVHLSEARRFGKWKGGGGQWA